MHIGCQAVAGDANATHAALTGQTKSQHYRLGQRQAVRAQLHAFPTTGLAPQLPSGGMTAQAGKGMIAGQQDMPG